MKLRIRTQDDLMYPYRDVESHAALTMVSLKRQVARELEYLLTHMDNSIQELHITIEVILKQEDTPYMH